MARLIQVTDIPASLWDLNRKALKLPPQLVEVWTALLRQNDLFEKAKTPAPKGFAGGIDKEATDNHFAWRFTGSCARTELSILDPGEELSNVADTYVKLFSGGKIFIADIPCGAGSASLTLLTVIAELRNNKIIPSMPLFVTILGGEISTYAQSYFIDIYNSLHQWFELNSIHVTYSTTDWDVCDVMSNTELIKKSTLKSQHCENKLLLVANFSDFLQKNGKYNEAKPHLLELFRHSCAEASVGIWIEPGESSTVRELFAKVKDTLNQVWKKLGNESLLFEGHKTTSADTELPLGGGTFRTSLSVVRFELPERMK